MFRELGNQFSLTRATLSTCGRAKSIPVRSTATIALFLLIAIGIFIQPPVTFSADGPRLDDIWNRLIADSTNGPVAKDYVREHSTTTGFTVLRTLWHQGMKDRWPFNEGISSKLISEGRDVNGSTLQFDLSKPGFKAVKVSTLWLRVAPFPWRKFSDYIDDLRIDTVGDRTLNLSLSQWITNRALAQRNLAKNLSKDLEITEAILDELSGKRRDDLDSMVSTPQQLDAVRQLRNAISKASALRKQATTQVRKINNEMGANASVGSKDLLSATAKFIYENEGNDNVQKSFTSEFTLAFLSDNDLKALNESLDKLCPFPKMPTELGWFLDMNDPN